MSNVRSSRSRFSILGKLAILAFGLGIYATPTPVSAVVIAGPHICVYYSDSTRTTAVGARGEGCCNSVISWGTTSSFVRCERLLCPDVLCPQ